MKPVLYRLFRGAHTIEAPSVRPVVIALVIAAICLVSAGVIRVPNVIRSAKSRILQQGTAQRAGQTARGTNCTG